MFPGSASADDLNEPFRQNFYEFFVAMERAGCNMTISSTYRPPERAYLMHFSWRIYFEHLNATKIPDRPGVDIEWDHGDSKASKKAAEDMRKGF